ncbi:MAG: DUF4258 domain-containing protein [Candidatus Vogelbacteria bacterium]|nr:DUF4258 domain-containing protein [Candidatus Vogelbacteria bacterium]
MIYYTEHAKERMILRGITEAMVKNALRKPDEMGIGYQGKSLAFKKFSKGIIKVVFVKKKNSQVIISAIWELRNKN